MRTTDDRPARRRGGRAGGAQERVEPASASDGGPPPESEFPRYSPAEQRADAAIHAIGLTLGLAGCVGLAVVARPRLDLPRLGSLGIYAASLLSMLACSALYNLTPQGPRKRLFRRLDHAAIFLMIAGTYTPFTLVVMGGAWGWGLLAAVWAMALAGIVGERRRRQAHKRDSVAAYLILGWIVVVASGPLMATMSPSGLVLLGAGGVLYSAGVVFHLWTSLPYQNAIWHGFVLAAAACHYLAVLREVAT